MQTTAISKETKIILGRTILNVSLQCFKWNTEKAMKALLERIGNPDTTEQHMKALDLLEEVYFKGEAYRKKCEEAEEEFIRECLI